MSRTLFLTVALLGCSEGGSADSCRIGPGARVCDPDIGCPDEIGCNWCGCNVYTMSTGGRAACNLAACSIQGGVIRLHLECRSDGECEGDDFCVFDPGCAGAPGRCTRRTACMSFGVGHPLGPGSVRVCGCDRRTKTVTVTGCAIGEPYRYIGPCS